MLRELGFRVCRVRHHGDAEPIARLEIGRDEMARALEPGRRRGDRSRAARARLSPRDARPARLSPRQPQRRAAPPPRLTCCAKSSALLAVVFARGAPGRAAADARRSRLGQFRARRARSSTSRSISRIRPGIPSTSRSASSATARARARRRRDAGRPRPGDLERDRRRRAARCCFFAFFRARCATERRAADRRAAIATVLTVCSPLFWFTRARPLSDLAGLAAAWAALAALGRGSRLPPVRRRIASRPRRGAGGGGVSGRAVDRLPIADGAS